MPILSDRFSQKLRALREGAGLSKRDLAAQMGVNENQIGKWENGVRPRPETEDALARFFEIDPAEFYLPPDQTGACAGPGLSREAARAIGRRIKTLRNGSAIGSVSVLVGLEPKEWEAVEAGELAIDYDLAARIADAMGYSVIEVLGKEGRELLKPAITEYTYIAHYPAEVSAGGGADNDHVGPPSYLAFQERYLRGRGLFQDQLFAVTVRGDSMEPELSDGDVVMVDLAHKDISEDALFVIRQASWLFVKRLQRRSSGKVMILSTNPKYEPEEVGPETPENEFQVIGKVVWLAREV